MPTLAQERCLNHESREAVCRCPSCRNFFCRECVVLFEERLLCAACLERDSAEVSRQAKRPFNVGTFSLVVLGFLVVWLLFYFAGWAILQFRERAPLPDRSDLALQVLA